ncbi:MAG TPA: hypothetical protein VKA66_19670, partial [Mycobacterium sp.]|nr:hypothetical protein [Mycobacterium sp.]
IGSRTSNPDRDPIRDQTTIQGVAALRMVIQELLCNNASAALPDIENRHRKRNNHGDFTTPIRR